MTKDEAIAELFSLRQVWEWQQQEAEADTTSDFSKLEGAIAGLVAPLLVIIIYNYTAERYNIAFEI
jgi:hypothetical protein